MVVAVMDEGLVMRHFVRDGTAAPIWFLTTSTIQGCSLYPRNVKKIRFFPAWNPDCVVSGEVSQFD